MSEETQKQIYVSQIYVFRYWKTLFWRAFSPRSMYPKNHLQVFNPVNETVLDVHKPFLARVNACLHIQCL